MAVSPETGRLLYMLVRATNAHSIVEFGTSFGLSTLHLAAGLKDNGGGRVIGSEFEPAKVSRAKENLALAGLTEFVEIREGDAIETLARDLPLLSTYSCSTAPKCSIHASYSRGKPSTPRIADRSRQRRPQPRIPKLRRNPVHGYLSVPFAEGVELFMKIGEATREPTFP